MRKSKIICVFALAFCLLSIFQCEYPFISLSAVADAKVGEGGMGRRGGGGVQTNPILHLNYFIFMGNFINQRPMGHNAHLNVQLRKLYSAEIL